MWKKSIYSDPENTFLCVVLGVYFNRDELELEYLLKKGS